VDDDEDVGKIVTDEIPRGLYKMGIEALLKDSRDARIKNSMIDGISFFPLHLIKIKGEELLDRSIICLSHCIPLHPLSTNSG